MKLLLGFVALAAIASMLVPASVLAQNDFKVFVVADGIHELDLRATEGTNGEVTPVSGFSIKPESVVQVHQNEALQVFTSTNEPQRIEKIKLTDASGVTTELVGNSLQGFAPGIYTLDIIVDVPQGGKGAYETVLVILSPIMQQANPTQVITQSVKTDVKVVFKEDNNNNNNNKKKDNLRVICALIPSDPRCDPKNGKCPPGFAMNEDGNCFPRGDCPNGYHRANDDETGRCVPERDLKQCEDGSWAHEDDTCPEDDVLVLPDCNADFSNAPCNNIEQKPVPEELTPEVLPPCSLVAAGETCDNTEKEDSWTDDEPVEAEEVEEEPEEEDEDNEDEPEEEEAEPEEEEAAFGG